MTNLEKFIEKLVQSKNSFGHIKCSFDEPAESSQRTPNTFSLNFRRKTWFFFRGKKPNSIVFSYLKFFVKSPQNYWSVLEKNVKVFSKINFSIKIFFTHRLQFWQTFWSFCAKMPETFPHSPKTVENFKNIRWKNSPIKNLHRTHWMEFWQTYRKIFADSPINLCPKTKNKEKTQGIRFQNQTLPEISPGHLKTVLTTMSKTFYEIPNIFHQSQFVGVKFLEEKDNVMQEDPVIECWKQFFKPGGRFSDRSLQSFTSKLEKIVKVIFFFIKHTFL